MQTSLCDLHYLHVDTPIDRHQIQEILTENRVPLEISNWFFQTIDGQATELLELRAQWRCYRV